jgi:hypothetical protein
MAGRPRHVAGRPWSLASTDLQLGIPLYHLFESVTTKPTCERLQAEPTTAWAHWSATSAHCLLVFTYEISILWAPTRPPSLNFCSSSSKARPEAMQEIQDNTSVDPTYLIELLWKKITLSWAVERWNLSSVSLLLSLLLKSIGDNMVTKIIWFLNLSHLGTLFGVCFLTSAQ